MKNNWKITIFWICVTVIISMVISVITGYICKEDTEQKGVGEIQPIQTDIHPLPQEQFKEVRLPYNKGTNFSTKAYMDYRKITDETSPQYYLIYKSGDIEISNLGFLNDSNGNIGVAMGSYFGDIGEKFRITFDNDYTIGVVKVEQKADADTDFFNIRDSAGGIIEFVVDTQTEFMQQNTKQNGYIFNGNFNNFEWLEGNIVKIERVVPND